MTFLLAADPVPLRLDEHGAVRVGASSVLLDVVIREFERGSSPESIAQGYDTLQLVDVYAVIAYYLRHRDEVNDYLRRRKEEAEELRRQIDARQPERPDLREKIRAGRTRLEQGRVSLSD